MNAPHDRPSPIGWRILIAGTGGQGVLTAARLLCDCFGERGHNVVSGQLHGMAQRGGAVQSSVIIDGGISPTIRRGQADFILGFEPVETARALPFMSCRTIVYMNTAPVIPFVLAQQAVSKEGTGQYPDVDHLVELVRAVAPQTIAFDATRWAVEAGSARALNMVMLGCLLGSGLLPATVDVFGKTIAERVAPASRKSNNQAFRKGAELAGRVAVGGEAR